MSLKWRRFNLSCNKSTILFSDLYYSFFDFLVREGTFWYGKGMYSAEGCCKSGCTFQIVQVIKAERRTFPNHPGWAHGRWTFLR